MKRFVSVGMIVFLLFSLCGCGSGKAAMAETGNSPVKGKKVAYILNMSSSVIFPLFENQCKEPAEKLA